jgi:ribonucleoside-triphosphate reductase (thioredoxin)
MCNLTELNVSDIESQKDLNDRAWAASILGTLQATYIDFHYLREIWRRNTEKDMLLGVSMTGIGSKKVQNFNIKEAAELIKTTNVEFASLLGIKPSARCTTIKPSGTSSLVLGTSSGIHA